MLLLHISDMQEQSQMKKKKILPTSPPLSPPRRQSFLSEGRRRLLFLRELVSGKEGGLVLCIIPETQE